MQGDLEALARLMADGSDPEDHGTEFASLVDVCLQESDAAYLQRSARRLYEKLHPHPHLRRALALADSLGSHVGRSTAVDEALGK